MDAGSKYPHEASQFQQIGRPPPHSEEQLSTQQALGNALTVLPSLLSDQDVAKILGVSVGWVRSHARGLAGFIRLGSYYRFHRAPLRAWLGSLDPLLEPEEAAACLKVPTSWVYANAE